MKDTYTITRWDNGWTVDVKTRDGLCDYTGVAEDPFWIEDEELSKAQSLAEILYNTFEKFLATEDKYGLVIEIEEPAEHEEQDEGEENDDKGCEGDSG